VVTYQPDSPSRMCDGSLDEAARMLRSASCLLYPFGLLGTTRTYIHASQAAIPTCAHINATSGLVLPTGLRPHTSASSMLLSPLPTRMSLHHLTPSHIPHLPSLLLDVQRLSSVVSQASGSRQQAGLVFSSRITNLYLPPDDASMQTQAAGHRERHGYPSPRYVALWSTVRAHRRHGRSPVQRP
jgi:hypothetical protein